MSELDINIFNRPGRGSCLHSDHQIVPRDGMDSEHRSFDDNQLHQLEKSLMELKDKIREYHNIILKYETFFREEISLFRLQKTKLTTMQEAFQHQELFTKEIEQHISSYIIQHSPQENNHSSFKRIILRFFHQNRFNQSCAHSKISEIEEIISKKQQLLENLQTEVQNWRQN